jgi:hypothetical protein
MRIVTLSLLLVHVIGCASYGPWPLSTETQRRARLLYTGMSVSEVTKMKGNPLLESWYNPVAQGSYMAALPEKYSGTAYYQIDGSISNEEVTFTEGKISSIKYVRAPWAGYDTWQRHQLLYDQQTEYQVPAP